MMILPAGTLLTIGSFPTTIGGIILLSCVLLGLSWWLTGKIFRERDRTTVVFRVMVSLLVFIGAGFFQQALVEIIRHGRLAPALETKEAREARLRENMVQWVAAPAFDAYWDSPSAEVQKLLRMSPDERRDYEPNRVDAAILTQSAVRALTWMALEHRHPSPYGRRAFPHAERGTKILNEFTVAQTQAMFDYILAVSPGTEREARPSLEDALAYSREPSGIAASQPAAQPAPGPYPFVQASRATSHGRTFVIRMSATQTRIIEAGSEEEALKIARQP